MTTDAAYHAWHQVFDKILRDLETKRLSPALADLLAGMGRNAAAQAEELAGTALEDDAARVADLIAVAAAALSGKEAGLSERAKAEKALIDEHAQSVESPILGTVTDYSLFTPRGHYTRSKALTRYFVAMSVLGQTAFRLPGSVQTDETTVNDPEISAWPCWPRARWSATRSWRGSGARSSSRRPSWWASPTTTRPSSWPEPSSPRSRAAWPSR